jgi:hypothetical protein
MPNDLTLVYYTANRISDFFANNIRDHLAHYSGRGLPIISVSHKPIKLGQNICIGETPPSFYNLYKQILIGCREIKTEYVACCEDDCLYTPEHFSYRPEKNIVAYNFNRWNVNGNVYYYRRRFGMCTCITETKLLLDILEQRYAKYPVEFPQDDRLRALLEPGKYQEYSEFPPVEMKLFETEIPVLTFNHRPSLGGMRKLIKGDLIEESLPYWGKAELLRSIFYG